MSTFNNNIIIFEYTHNHCTTTCNINTHTNVSCGSVPPLDGAGTGRFLCCLGDGLGETLGLLLATFLEADWSVLMEADWSVLMEGDWSVLMETDWSVLMEADWSVLFDFKESDWPFPAILSVDASAQKYNYSV